MLNKLTFSLLLLSATTVAAVSVSADMTSVFQATNVAIAKEEFCNPVCVNGQFRYLGGVTTILTKV